MARQMGRGAEVASRFSFSRRKGRSRYGCFFFLLLPKKRPRDANAERVARDRAAWCSLLFQAGRDCLLVRAPLRGKSYATSMAWEAETIFTLFPRRSFYIRSATFHQRLMDIWRRRSFVTRNVRLPFERIDFDAAWPVKRVSLFRKLQASWIKK